MERLNLKLVYTVECYPLALPDRNQFLGKFADRTENSIKKGVAITPHTQRTHHTHTLLSYRPGGF